MSEFILGPLSRQESEVICVVLEWLWCVLGPGAHDSHAGRFNICLSLGSLQMVAVGART